jgi:hypothetical protein
MFKRFMIGFVVGIAGMYWYIHNGETVMNDAGSWMESPHPPIATIKPTSSSTNRQVRRPPDAELAQRTSDEAAVELPVMRRLKKELDDLRFELRNKLPKEIEVARAHGDLRENAEYAAAKERQGFVNARIGQIEQRIRDLSLYTVSSIPQAAVGYGRRVTVETEDGVEEKYELVFPEEVAHRPA